MFNKLRRYIESLRFKYYDKIDDKMDEDKNFIRVENDVIISMMRNVPEFVETPPEFMEKLHAVTRENAMKPPKKAKKKYGAVMMSTVLIAVVAAVITASVLLYKPSVPGEGEAPATTPQDSVVTYCDDDMTGTLLTRAAAEEVLTDTERLFAHLDANFLYTQSFGYYTEESKALAALLRYGALDLACAIDVFVAMEDNFVFSSHDEYALLPLFTTEGEIEVFGQSNPGLGFKLFFEKDSRRYYVNIMGENAETAAMAFVSAVGVDK